MVAALFPIIFTLVGGVDVISKFYFIIFKLLYRRKKINLEKGILISCLQTRSLFLFTRYECLKNFKVNGFVPPESKIYAPLRTLGNMEALAQVKEKNQRLR